MVGVAKISPGTQTKLHQHKRDVVTMCARGESTDT